MDLRNSKMLRLKALEQKMNEIVNSLHKDYSYTLGESLLDSEGYPRNDIDTYLVSKLIKEYKNLLTEYKPLRRMVEEEVFDALRDEASPELK